MDSDCAELALGYNFDLMRVSVTSHEDGKVG